MFYVLDGTRFLMSKYKTKCIRPSVIAINSISLPQIIWHFHYSLLTRKWHEPWCRSIVHLMTNTKHNITQQQFSRAQQDRGWTTIWSLYLIPLSSVKNCSWHVRTFQHATTRKLFLLKMSLIVSLIVLGSRSRITTSFMYVFDEQTICHWHSYFGVFSPPTGATPRVRIF